MTRTVVARAPGPLGEVVLRRWDDGTDGAAPDFDLVVDGVFVMDTQDATSERVLASGALGALPAGRVGLRVLVGGLGLGFTADAALADPRVARVEVVEIQPALVDWLRAGLVPQAVPVMSDPRLTVTVDDIVSAAGRWSEAAFDAILLDVDNGPDFLVAAPNARVYTAPFLARCARALAPDGVLAVWSAEPDDALRVLLGETVGETRVVSRTVDRAGHELTYTVYLATRRRPGLGDGAR